jgi:hypothetical protein
LSIPSGRAILTTYYSEDIYKPLWDRYYLPFFDHHEAFIYPFDMKSDYAGRVKILNGMMHKLLDKYRVVVIADLDELIVPNPDKYKDLGDYLDRFDKPGIRVTGYDVMEMPGAQQLNLDCKITDQRHYWYRDEQYDKPMVATTKFLFNPGKHTCDAELDRDDDLVLFHLRDADLYFLVTSCGLQRDRAFLDNILKRQMASVEIPGKWRVI